MGNSRVTVTGGMGPSWISTIAKSRGVTDQVNTTYSEIKRKAEARANSRYPLSKSRSGRFHYGSKSRKGSWGVTWIVWGITTVARDNVRWMRAAISSAKNVHQR